jgi:hypothetical protein
MGKEFLTIRKKLFFRKSTRLSLPSNRISDFKIRAKQGVVYGNLS